MEQNYKTRKRVNYSVSVKGVVTPDVTVEILDADNEEVLSEAKKLLESAMLTAEEKSGGV